MSSLDPLFSVSDRRLVVQGEGRLQKVLHEVATSTRARCPELLQAKVKSHTGSSDPLSVMNSVIDEIAKQGAFSGPCEFDAYREEYKKGDLVLLDDSDKIVSDLVKHVRELVFDRNHAAALRSSQGRLDRKRFAHPLSLRFMENPLVPDAWGHALLCLRSNAFFRNGGCHLCSSELTGYDHFLVGCAAPWLVDLRSSLIRSLGSLLRDASGGRMDVALFDDSRPSPRVPSSRVPIGIRGTLPRTSFTSLKRFTTNEWARSRLAQVRIGPSPIQVSAGTLVWLEAQYWLCYFAFLVRMGVASTDPQHLNWTADPPRHSSRSARMATVRPQNHPHE
jgi:hypothetical protein